MNKVLKIVSVFALLFVFISPLYARADSHDNIGEAKKEEYKKIAKAMIEMHDSMNMHDKNKTTTDPRFTNDMFEKQKKLESELAQKIEKAKKNKEKFYTMDEILNASAEDFGISEEDMQRIKDGVYMYKQELTLLVESFDSLGKSDHEIAKRLKKELEMKWPKSLIYVDHSKDKQDGMISGGGWPYCLDDNGWGYKNFITSDCYKAIIGFKICAADSTLGKMDPDLRYCKAYVRNCSPLIGHSKYWHEHSWWQQIP
jgi:hypothetical protein